MYIATKLAANSLLAIGNYLGIGSLKEPTQMLVEPYHAILKKTSKVIAHKTQVKRET